MQAKEITSSANATYKMLSSLLTSKGMQKNGLALISGRRFINEIASAFPQYLEGWITCDDTPPPAPINWWRLPKALHNDLDQAGTGGPLLLARIPEIKAYDPNAPWPKGCTLFLPFQNPDNCGAIIRSAAAFGVARVVLLKEAAHPFHVKSTRAAGPAVFQVPLFVGPSIHELTFGNEAYFSLSAEGKKLADVAFPEVFGLLPGVEGPGVPANLRSRALSIPMEPGVESLNAATATAVALYEWRRGLI